MFLLASPEHVFAPERFGDDQRLIAETAESFAQHEIAPAGEKIEAKDFAVTRGLLRQAGALGLAGVEVPEAYGGQGLDFTASAIVADHMAVQGSFSVAFGAHVGIGTLPLVYFGDEAQKRAYLPRLASAEWIAAYALSEAASGSDALAMKTQAAPSADGQHYVLNGEKMWISNAGFADLFTIFAKVDGRATAFLVEASSPGLSTGAEEHKMGIEGSSTRAVLLRDVRVPAGNVLGGVGEGAHIAFQILNVGRFKLGAACIGGARNVLRPTVAYTRQRHTFGQPICSFGLVRQHLAEMAARLWAAEAVVYRTAGLLDSEHRLDAFPVECSIVKVVASEMLDRVVDLAVQLHGGNGFVRGNPAERAFRDARVNRIFEGTNEINRLLIPGMLLRQAQKGALALQDGVKAVSEELLAPPRPNGPAEQARKAALLLAGLAWQRFGEGLGQEQEVLAALADLMIAAYTVQSAVARDAADPRSRLAVEACLEAIETTARRALAAISAGDELRTQLAWLRRLLKREPVDTIGLQRRIASALLDI